MLDAFGQPSNIEADIPSTPNDKNRTSARPSGNSHYGAGRPTTGLSTRADEPILAAFPILSRGTIFAPYHIDSLLDFDLPAKRMTLALHTIISDPRFMTDP